MLVRPNIIYLHSHDTGRCTEPYGFPVPMPAFRRLAETGMTFRQAFSAAPTCSPSRAALLTGMAPHCSGMLGLAHRGFDLNDPEQHLAHFLRSNNYRTVLAGHQHLTRNDPRELGYDRVYPSGNGHASVVVPNAVQFLHEAGAGSESPFFLDIGFDETHRPFHDAQPDDARYVSVLPGQPDNRETRLDTARFHASLRALDRGVAEVLDTLERTGLAESTIVILTTDHGPAFPGMKSTLTDGGIGVGLLVRAPGVTSPGTVCDALVSQIDLFPTMCELANLDPPGWLQGSSLSPLLDGSATSVRNELFAEVTFHAAYEPQRAIRTTRWTYIRRFDERRLPVLPNIDPSPALDARLVNGWADLPIQPIMLFDNLLDPMQRENVSGLLRVTEVETELHDRLARWMVETNDPLVSGHVDLPPGALVNRSSDRSPDDALVTIDFS